jgi:predicted transcriptional regulator
LKKDQRYSFLGSSTVRTAKQEVRKILDEIPENASFEDIQYHIYVRQKIERALQDVKKGRLITQQEAERRMSKWLRP